MKIAVITKVSDTQIAVRAIIEKIGHVSIGCDLGNFEKLVPVEAPDLILIDGPITNNFLEKISSDTGISENPKFFVYADLSALGFGLQKAGEYQFVGFLEKPFCADKAKLLFDLLEIRNGSSPC